MSQEKREKKEEKTGKAPETPPPQQAACIEINAFTGEGYQPLVARDGWRVALINSCERLRHGCLAKLERHLETEEVFVLLQGSATLHIGREPAAYPLQPQKTYTVPRGVWHGITMGEASAVLVVENDSTGPQNSEYFYFE